MASSYSDIPLARDPSTKLVPWIVGFMVFLASLAAIGGLRLTGVADQWRDGLSGTITIQVPPLADDSEAETDARARAALETVRGTRGLGGVALLSEERMAGLLEPWLGRALDPTALPLPRLISAEVADADALDLAGLRRRLEAAVPGASVDDHQLWRERMVDLMRLLQLLAWTVVGLVAACAAIMVVFATRGGLAMHRNVVEVLHLIGARDTYIARQFQRQALRAAAWGGCLGALAGASVVVMLLYLADALQTGGTLPALLRDEEWLALVLIPVFTAILAVLTARLTVIRTLARLV